MIVVCVCVCVCVCVGVVLGDCNLSPSVHVYACMLNCENEIVHWQAEHWELTIESAIDECLGCLVITQRRL